MVRSRSGHEGHEQKPVLCFPTTPMLAGGGLDRFTCVYLPGVCTTHGDPLFLTHTPLHAAVCLDFRDACTRALILGEQH